ncbi:MAG: hypothetical protein H7293_08035, partial [Candidatus Saccharibacteria bacterium]|nr:hypothetical protein [Rhodoferax sp.]
MKLNWKQRFVALMFVAAAGTGAQAACLVTEVEPNDSDSSASVGLCSGVNVVGSISSSSDAD